MLPIKDIEIVKEINQIIKVYYKYMYAIYVANIWLFIQIANSGGLTDSMHTVNKQELEVGYISALYFEIL